jgi:hypothetical protein
MKDPLIEELDTVRDRIELKLDTDLAEELLRPLDVVKAVTVLQVLTQRRPTGAPPQVAADQQEGDRTPMHPSQGTGKLLINEEEKQCLTEQSSIEGE